MNVLKATTEQAKKIEGTYKNKSQIVFSLDANNNLVVSENVLYDSDFIDIKDLLFELELIEYIPLIIND
jgi:hypothetical protein